MATEPEATIYERLAEPFPIHCVEWKPRTVDRTGRRALALAYIDARSVMAKLDEVLGPENWQDSYRHEGGRMICRLSLRINGEWIAKEDGSGDSANFEAEKGGISGAFKRAAVKWGIGRYLYDVDALWADCDAYKQQGGGRGGKDRWVFQGWTENGMRALTDALQRAPGPRSTEKPFSVEKTLEQVRDAQSVSEVRDIYRRNWEIIPLEYRTEVLRAMETRKGELARNERNDEHDDGAEQGDADRQSRGRSGDQEPEQRRQRRQSADRN